MINFSDFQQECAVKINDFINDENVQYLFIKTTSPIFCKQLIDQTANDYNISELFYNIKYPYQLLYILRQQLNPNKSKEYKFFTSLNIHGINPLAIISDISNLFKHDISTYSTQIFDTLKKINSSKFVVLLCVDDDICPDLIYCIENIFNLLPKLKSKFIFLYKKTENIQLMNLIEQDCAQKMEIIYNDDLYIDEFEKLSSEQIKSLRAVTDDDFDEMFNVLKYLNNFTDFELDKIEDIVMQRLKRRLDDNKSNVLGIASFFNESFSYDELQEICKNYAYMHIDSLISTLEESIETKIIKLNNEKYSFYAILIKNLVKKIHQNDKVSFNLAIAKYLKTRRPFDYELRKYHLKNINDEKYKEVLIMQFLNHLHFNKEVSTELQMEIIQNYNENLFYDLKEIFNLIANENYSAAMPKVYGIDCQSNKTLYNEIIYLNLYLEWKLTRDIRDKSLLDAAERILADCEPETWLFTSLLKLSICTNMGNHIVHEDSQIIYNAIISKLKEYDGADSDYILNIIYRKSNAAILRSSSITLNKKSFKYFCDNKELYPKQYYMSGTNYAALLIQNVTMNKEFSYNLFNNQPILYESNNPYFILKTLLNEMPDSVSNEFKNNLINNYIISKFLYSEDNLSDTELEDIAASVSSINSSYQTMTYMNIGTIYAMKDKMEKAKYYWDLANKANENKDEYFDYIINLNSCVADAIKGRVENTEFNYTNSIPGILNDIELKQYVKYRYKIMEELISIKKQFTYAEAKEFFNKKFYEHFAGIPLYFHSQPYILSDTQYWTEN